MAMKRVTYNLVKEPRGETYQRLIAHLSSNCYVFLLVLRHSVNVSPSAKSVLKKLEPFLLAQSEESTWPGTVLLDETATVYTFSLSSEAIHYLSSAAGGLFSWIQPELPEDLCLIRFDGSPCLVTITHEKDGYLVLSDEEYRNLVAEIPDLVAIITA
jgi:hypothetical protein